MADGKLTYEVDFIAHTEGLAAAISRVIDEALAARVGSIDRAVASLGERIGSPYIYENVRSELGSVVGPNASIADFAAMAAANPYRYKPSTIQTLVRNTASKAAAQYEADVDLQYKMDAEAATGEIRGTQRKLRAAELATTLLEQGNYLRDAAETAATPEQKRMLLSRAASRYGSIASRSIMEAGGVSPETATQALILAADMAAIRSGIKTQNQLLAEDERRKARAINATLAWKDDQIAYSNSIIAGDVRARREAQKEIEDSWGWAAAHFKAENVMAATKAAEEDLAWGTRGYSETKKAKEMEKGFRVMEATSATESIYNPNTDPAVARSTMFSAVSAAERYAKMATTFGEGTPERAAYVQMAKSALGGVTPNSMAKVGMTSTEIKDLTTAIINVTKILEGMGGGSGSGAGSTDYKGIGQQIGRLMAAGGTIARDIMTGRTSWLADMNTPWQTRRDVRQDWAIKYGQASIIPGAIGGAMIGGATLGPVGAIGGAIIGGGVGLVGSLWGQHNKDEKKIGESIQNRMVDMIKYRSLYGSSVDYNYAQLISNMGYASTDSVLGLNVAADMLPGAMMFGGVGEQQMMALSYVPNYWRALMNGASTAELYEAYANDIMALPKQTRQYITSLLPGVNEELRAFAQSESFGLASGLANRMSKYDEYQYGLSGGYIMAKNYAASENMKAINRNIANETATAGAPNYFRSTAEFNAAMAQGAEEVYGTAVDPAIANKWNEVRRMLNLREFDVGNSGGKLGDIIINIDGRTVYQEEYSTEGFISGMQSFVVGG